MARQWRNSIKCNSLPVKVVMRQDKSLARPKLKGRLTVNSHITQIPFMQIQLTPGNVRSTAALRVFVAEKLDRLTKMVGDILSARVVFNRAKTAEAGAEFRVKVRLAVRGKDIFASDRDGNLYAAIDKVTAKLARLLRKRKTRLLQKRESRSRSAARRHEAALLLAFYQPGI